MKLTLTGTVAGRIYQSYVYNDQTHTREIERLALPFKLVVKDDSVSFNSYASGRLLDTGETIPPGQVKYRQKFEEQETEYRQGRDNGGGAYERIEISGPMVKCWHTQGGENKEFFKPCISLQTWDRKELFIDMPVITRGGRGKRAWVECNIASEIVALDENSAKALVSLLDSLK